MTGEDICSGLIVGWASLVAQLVENLRAMLETWVRSLGWDESLEKERLPTSVFWPGEFHGLYSPWGRRESNMTERLSLSLQLGSPFQLFLSGAHVYIYFWFDDSQIRFH